MSYHCSILADSLSPAGVRLTTFEVTFPRIVLAEFNTHRQFARNSASSRAIPVEKQIDRVMVDTFAPVYWGKNQKGMQADQELDGPSMKDAMRVWYTHAKDSISAVLKMTSIGAHKQITNRLLEPFMWHTVIVTATEWQNFFNLRCHPAAQPEIRVIAEMMREAYDAGMPTSIPYDGWHLPLIDWDDHADASIPEEDLPMVSAGRCARVSYLTHDGRRDPKEDIALAKRLREAGHMSPFEHPCMPFTRSIEEKVDAAKIAFSDYRPDHLIVGMMDAIEFCGPFRGWIQLRKTMPGEAIAKPFAP